MSLEFIGLTFATSKSKLKGISPWALLRLLNGWTVIVQALRQVVKLQRLWPRLRLKSNSAAVLSQPAISRANLITCLRTLNAGFQLACHSLLSFLKYKPGCSMKSNSFQYSIPIFSRTRTEATFSFMARPTIRFNAT